MLECLITGCDLLVGYHQQFHGDLHQDADVYIFNAVVDKENVPVVRKPSLDDSAVMLLMIPPDVLFFERRGVFVVPKTLATLNLAARNYLSNGIAAVIDIEL